MATLLFDQVPPVLVSCNELSIQLKSRKKTASEPQKLLENILFQIPPGNVFAIMGGSGLGKTTLLNSLAHRVSNSSSFSQSGTITYNLLPDLGSVSHAYVIQQDILVPTLTCRETLRFSARLRLLKTVLYEKQDQLIEQIIAELGLKDCADTMVGSRQHKGLSGGEKRRLSIGIQLLVNPSVIFLDEPTTGLDAHSAILLIHTLKNLAKKGRTVIMSIHQPPSEVFFMFDFLCILSRGFPVFCGKTSSVLGYFEGLGFKVEKNANPADFLIDITSVDVRTEESEKKTLERLEMFKNSRKSILVSSLDEELDLLQNEKCFTKVKTFLQAPNISSRPALVNEVYTLLHKELLLILRDPLTPISLVLEAIFMGVVLGWVFYKPDDSLTGIRTKGGAIYCVNGLQGYLMMVFETYRLCFKDIKIFDRERADGLVSVAGFVISRRILKMLSEDFWIPTVFTVITYPMLGIRQTGKGFGVYWLVNILNHQIAMAVALFSAAVSRDYALASTIGNVNFTFQSYCSGYFINTATMPVYVRWIKYICYVWYGYGLTASLQFSDFFGDCPYSSDPEDPRCMTYTGKSILRTLGFWENWITVPEVAMLTIWAIFTLLAMLILWARKVDVAVAKQSKKGKTSKSGHSEFLGPKKTKEGINVRLQKISLGVRVMEVSFKGFLNTLLFRQNVQTKKQILDNVSATFHRNKVNAIMGPSGSGKTSLLNFVSGKLHSNFGTRYTSLGEVYFNDLPVDKTLLLDICSYVLQDDDNLLPALTVRETLMYSARMRLSRTHSREEIESKVNSVILKLGLKECQNNLIGSELVKGISGGEKRRVSIGLQLLNDPEIIFLDEPTSGLDSFTALSILTILENLAAEGTTVVLTIHQPRYLIFQRFGQVLLLCKGGLVAFNGLPSEMAAYFERHGHTCPELTNFADFALDLVLVNVQSPELEDTTSKRVQLLVESWKLTEQAAAEEEAWPPEKADYAQSRAVFSSYKKTRATFLSAFRVVLVRQWRNLRAPIMFARIFQTCGTGIILAVFYAPLKKNYVGITNILGLVQQILSVYFVGMLNNVALYPEERNYFYEEYADKVYGLAPFFLVYTIWETMFEVIASAIYAALAVMVIGLPRTPGVYFCFAYCCLLLVSCGESLGIFFNTIFDHTGFAINVISTFLSIAVFMAGLLSLELPSFFKGLNYINPVHYAVIAAVNIVLDSEKHFTCTPTEGGDGQGGCIFNSGADVLDTYGLRVNWRLYLGLMAVMAVIYRGITLGVLYMKIR